MSNCLLTGTKLNYSRTLVVDKDFLFINYFFSSAVKLLIDTVLVTQELWAQIGK